MGDGGKALMGAPIRDLRVLRGPATVAFGIMRHDTRAGWMVQPENAAKLPCRLLRPGAWVRPYVTLRQRTGSLELQFS
jgi:hypothetical protein